jgi:hypothetical protein
VSDQELPRRPLGLSTLLAYVIGRGTGLLAYVIGRGTVVRMVAVWWPWSSVLRRAGYYLEVATLHDDVEYAVVVEEQTAGESAIGPEMAVPGEQRWRTGREPDDSGPEFDRPVGAGEM